MMKLLKKQIIPGSFALFMVSWSLSMYPGFDPNRTTTPTRALGGVVLELSGASHWGKNLSFLVQPSIIIFFLSLTIYIVKYPRDFKDSLINYFKETRQRFKDNS